MRVMHVISGLRVTAGGTVAAMTALAAAQRHAGAEVKILSTFVENEDDAAENLRRDGHVVHQIGPCRNPLSRHPRLAEKVDQEVSDSQVVHIHALWEEVQHQAARSARRHRVPYVFSPHGMLDPWSLKQSKWKKRLYLMWRLRRDLNHAAAIHFTSDIERDLTARLALKAPAMVIPLGIDLSEFANLPARGALRSRFGLPNSNPMVLFLGRLHPKKGLDLLVKAMARVRPDAALVIAGPDEGDYRRMVEQMVTQHELTNRTIFTGLLRGRERIEALVDADLFVLPSYQENFGIAVLEALAAGCPVVISDQVNIHREISAAGVGGVVPTDAVAVANEIDRWLDDPIMRAQAGARAPEFVRDNFELAHIARRWLDHYHQFIDREGKGPAA